MEILILLLGLALLPVILAAYCVGLTAFVCGFAACFVVLAVVAMLETYSSRNYAWLAARLHRKPFAVADGESLPYSGTRAVWSFIRARVEDLENASKQTSS